jgi:hypothetical protein
MLFAMLLIGAGVFRMVSNRTLVNTSSVLWLCCLLMLGVFGAAGRRAPGKALVALGFALVCGVLAWSGLTR